MSPEVFRVQIVAELSADLGLGFMSSGTGMTALEWGAAVFYGLCALVIAIVLWAVGHGALLIAYGRIVRN